MRNAWILYLFWRFTFFRNVCFFLKSVVNFWRFKHVMCNFPILFILECCGHLLHVIPTWAAEMPNKFPIGDTYFWHYYFEIHIPLFTATSMKTGSRVMYNWMLPITSRAHFHTLRESIFQRLKIINHSYAFFFFG